MQATLFNRILVNLFFISISFSCSQGVNTINFKESTANLVTANKNLAKQNDSLYDALQNKMNDETYRGIADFWLPRAMLSQSESHSVYKFLETLTQHLKANSEVSNEDSLYTILISYRKDILAIDPEIHEKIRYEATSITHYFDSIKQTTTASVEKIFSQKPTDEKLYIIELTRHNIKTVENAVAFFCNYKTNILK